MTLLVLTGPLQSLSCIAAGCLLKAHMALDYFTIHLAFKHELKAMACHTAGCFTPTSWGACWRLMMCACWLWSLGF